MAEMIGCRKERNNMATNKSFAERIKIQKEIMGKAELKAWNEDLVSLKIL